MTIEPDEQDDERHRAAEARDVGSELEDAPGRRVPGDEVLQHAEQKPPANASGTERNPPTTAAAAATKVIAMKPACPSEPMIGAPTTPASAASIMPMTHAQRDVVRSLIPRVLARSARSSLRAGVLAVAAARSSSVVAVSTRTFFTVPPGVRVDPPCTEPPCALETSARARPRRSTPLCS